MTPLFDRRGIPAHTYECVVDHDIEHPPLLSFGGKASLYSLLILFEETLKSLQESL
jgi:hypothetical protein